MSYCPQPLFSKLNLLVARKDGTIKISIFVCRKDWLDSQLDIYFEIWSRDTKCIFLSTWNKVIQFNSIQFNSKLVSQVKNCSSNQFQTRIC